MDHLQEIKSRLSVEELVSSYVPLKRAGKNFKANCPFHAEKTPSFIVSPDKEIAYCFGCNKGGDIFKLMQLLENCDFGEAVKLLAERTGVKLPRELPKTANKRLRVIEMNELAAKFFCDNLNQHANKKEYFEKRGLSAGTIRQFRLGYAPDSFSALKDHMTGKGYVEAELIEAGLLIQRSLADKSSFDRFRNRLIFPIFDAQGCIVGFGGRIIGEGEPKYLNSPETPAYNKSLTLYGLHFAKDAIKKEGMAIFVEGYMDVIAAHQAGTVNVVATSGTALTPHQLKIIKRYTPRVAFCFDQDAAGMEATLRALQIAQHGELEISIIMVTEGKDPDECIQKNPKAWQQAVLGAIPAMDFYFEYAKRQWDADSIDNKKKIAGFLLAIIKHFQTEMEQWAYIERLALMLHTDSRLLWNDLKKTKPYSTLLSENLSAAATQADLKQVFTREMYLLGLISQYPQLYPTVIGQLIDNIPFDPETKLFYNLLKSVYARDRALDFGVLKQELDDEHQEKMDILRLLIEDHYPDFSEDAAEREMRDLIREINRKNLYAVQKEYEFKIRGAQNPKDRNLILNQYNEILKLNAKL